MSMYSIGVSALNNAQLALTTSSHNIANANNTAYHRQETVITTQVPTPTGAGAVGNGAYIANIKRAYSAFLDGQVLDVSGTQSYQETLLNNLSQVDGLVADSSAGLSTALSDYFKTVESMAANPANIPSRQLMLSSGSALVARFQTLDQRLEDLYNGANEQIDTSIGQVNSLAQQIGNLNTRIVAAESAAGNHEANDLRDQRDDLITQLNKFAKVQVTVDDSGGYNVSIGNGVGLVIGSSVATISTAPGKDNPQRLDLYVTLGAGQTLLARSSLDTGQLGALMQFRDGEVTDARNSLGRLAMVFANSFNIQHQLGQDLNGNLGGQFYSVATPVVRNSTLNTGTGALTATVSNYAQLQASDYRIVYNGAGYNVTRLSDGTQTAQAGPSFIVDGVTFDFGATSPNTGDAFYVQPVIAGATNLQQLISDPNLIAAALPLRSAAGAANTGTAALSVQSISTTTGIPAAGTMRTLTYGAGGYTSSNGGDTVTLNGTTLTVNTGSNVITLQVSGTPSNGDTFTIDRNTGGNTDNHNGLLLGKIATTNLLNAGASGVATTTLQGAYGQMVSAIGTRTREVKVANDAQSSLLDGLKATQQSFSGVNLDEEAAKLIQNQQQYQAASKIIAIAKETLDQIFNIMG